MRLGFGLPYAGSWATPANQAAIATSAEELGWASLWTAQRILYPDEPQNDYYATPGAPWPAPFRSMVDPVLPLAYVAALTSRIRIGTASIMLPIMRPVLLAKQLTTLDLLCGGRLDVGVSLGWSKDEFQAAGVDFARRGARFEEYLEAMVAVWRGEGCEFSGEFVELPRSQMLPAPVQRPHPPLLIGGYADAGLRRAAKYQGYLGGNMPLDTIVDVLGRLDRYAEEAGRDPKDLRKVSRGVTLLRDAPSGPGRRPLCGTLEEIAEDIERYAAAGLTELFLDLNFDPEVGVLDADPGASMDRALTLLETFAPAKAS
ncbi:MAG: TIGR03619 family F420-dependent LLM class oxidoreductase [Sporichthyaceae bacterium]